MIDFRHQAEPFPGWLQPEETPDWLHYFPTAGEVSLCGAYSSARSESFYDLHPRIDLIKDFDCCRGCLGVLQGIDPSEMRRSRDESTRMKPLGKRIPGKSVLAESIAEGFADPISELERQLARRIHETYEQKFGSKTTKKKRRGKR